MRKRSFITEMLVFAVLLFTNTSVRSAGQGTAKPATPAKASAPASAPASSKAPAAAKTQPLDLNTATADQLKALPGIGDAYAKRIIDGRPYTAKNQLTARGVVPQSTYDKIKDSIVAHRPAKS